MAQMVKNLPAVQKTWVQSLSQEDPVENEMATHSSILAWRIPWTVAYHHSQVSIISFLHLLWEDENRGIIIKG